METQALDKFVLVPNESSDFNRMKLDEEPMSCCRGRFVDTVGETGDDSRIPSEPVRGRFGKRVNPSQGVHEPVCG